MRGYKNEWRSFYIYPLRSSEEDLLGLLSQLMMAEPGQPRLPLSDIFFVRFFDAAGPHIRLRLRIPEKTFSDDILAFLTGTLMRYNMSAKVLESTYEPEFERYGGISAMNHSENVFIASSRWVLGSGVWALSYERRLALAALSLAMVLVVWERQSKDALDLISACRTDRFFIEAQRSARSYNAVETFYLDAVKEHASHWQRHRTTACECVDGTRELGTWGRAWITTVDCTLRALAEYPFKQRSTSVIFASLVHMHNNRLGVRLEDEALIASGLYACWHGDHDAPLKSKAAGEIQ